MPKNVPDFEDANLLLRLYEERREKRDELFSSLETGQRVKGVVRSIAPFGVFVDLGGIDGLVHKSELSWNKVNNPETAYQIGDEVEAEVIDINHERGRISLSIRRLQPDPWQESVAKYQIGDVIEGTVTKLVNFGAFVRVEEGLEGLIHISELSNQRVAHPGDVVKEGEVLKLKIISLDSERHRLGLSLKQAEDRPAPASVPAPAVPAGRFEERPQRRERGRDRDRDRDRRGRDYRPEDAISEPDERGYRTVMATINGHFDLAMTLIDRGANPNDFYMAGDARYSALVGVAAGGEQDCPRQPQSEALYAAVGTARSDRPLVSAGVSGNDRFFRRGVAEARVTVPSRDEIERGERQRCGWRDVDQLAVNGNGQRRGIDPVRRGGFFVAHGGFEGRARVLDRDGATLDGHAALEPGVEGWAGDEVHRQVGRRHRVVDDDHLVGRRDVFRDGRVQALDVRIGDGSEALQDRGVHAWILSNLGGPDHECS